LHRPKAAVLPCHPLLGARNVEVVGEAEFVVWVVVARQVRQDGYACQLRETSCASSH
jgi:hypothetical protein